MRSESRTHELMVQRKMGRIDFRARVSNDIWDQPGSIDRRGWIVSILHLRAPRGILFVIPVKYNKIILLLMDVSVICGKITRRFGDRSGEFEKITVSRTEFSRLFLFP
jgi:hypothetical protein